MPFDGDRMEVGSEAVDDVTVLRPCGVLDSGTYRTVRDTIVKAALDDPRGVVVDLADLRVSAESALAVFTSAAWHVGRWPQVPIMLVSEWAPTRSALARHGVTGRIPVYASVPAALDALAALRTQPLRRRVHAELPCTVASLQRARDLVERSLTTWCAPELIPTAKVVATTLVENVLMHTESSPTLLLEFKEPTVTVAVADDDPRPGVLPESVAAGPQPSGLRIIAALCRTWGNTPSTSGKAVWALLGPENAL